jgi:hypothetical protein
MGKKYKSPIIGYISLFLTAFIQVYFVAVNTYFIAKEIYIGVWIAAFMINIIWSFNIKKMAFGSFIDRMTYAVGATLGSVVGLWSSSFITSLIDNL